MLKSCQTFRKLLQNDCIPIVGAYNGMVARQVASHGFQACYVSGAAVSASAGQPDIGLITQDGFCKIIKEVHFSSGLPVIADADTGFGEGEMCAKTVYEYYNSGAAGLHLEDQVFPKRCGHLDGKSLISIDDMVKKVQIAVNASKQCSEGEFLICARTDGRGVEGLEASITRAKAYIDAGADMIFPEGLQSEEEFREVAKILKNYQKKNVLLLANMTEFGKTPYIKLNDFKDMGYNCVIYPVSTLRIASKAIDLFLQDLKQNGSQEKSVPLMQTRKELYQTLGYTPGEEWYYPNPIKKD